MRVDVHQHAWTDPLVEMLARRRTLPFVDRRDGLCVLHCAAEQPYPIDFGRSRVEHGSDVLDRERLDAAIVALSSPIGIEMLPRDSAEVLIEAHLRGIGELDEGFHAWGPLALEDCDPDDVDSLLDRGCIGISLPACALAGADQLRVIAPTLERIEARDVPLFVHPGPPPTDFYHEASPTEPLWWRALTDYVAQMQAAWLTFAAFGRRDHPRLVIVFAMLAGGAPLLSERLQARGGPPIDLRDRQVFYDTSSYGPSGIGLMATRVGIEQLVYGSDRPVIEPLSTEHDELLQCHAARLLLAQERTTA